MEHRTGSPVARLDDFRDVQMKERRSQRDSDLLSCLHEKTSRNTSQEHKESMGINANLFASDGSERPATRLSMLQGEQDLGGHGLEGDLEKMDLEGLEKSLEKLKRKMAECEEKFRCFKGHLRKLQVEYNNCRSRLIQHVHEQVAHQLRVHLETAGELLTENMGKQLKDMKVAAVVPEEIIEIKEDAPQRGRLMK
jgi:hypothetical protein